MNGRATRTASLLAGVLLGLMAGTAAADDIDIYTGAIGSAGAGETRNNVLFMFDTSDSMKREVPGTGMTRLQIMQSAVSNMLQTIPPQVNVGLAKFNGSTGGSILFPAAPPDDPRKEHEPVPENTALGSGYYYQYERHDYITGDHRSAFSDPYMNTGRDKKVITDKSAGGYMAQFEDATQAVTGPIRVTLEKHVLDDGTLLVYRFNEMSVPRGAKLLGADPALSRNDPLYDAWPSNLSGYATLEDTTRAAKITGTEDLFSRPKLPWVHFEGAPFGWQTGLRRLAASGGYDAMPLLPLLQRLVCRGADPVASPHCAGMTGGPGPAWDQTSNSVALYIKVDASDPDFDPMSPPTLGAHEHDLVGTDGATFNRNGYFYVRYELDPPQGYDYLHQGYTVLEGVDVPRGATIVSADLMVGSYYGSWMNGRFRIFGEADGNPYDIRLNGWLPPGDRPWPSERPVTAASVLVDPAVTPWGNFETKNIDVKDIVQEIVNRADWCGGNLMGFLFRPVADTEPKSHFRANSLLVRYIPPPPGAPTCARRAVSLGTKRYDKSQMAQELPDGTITWPYDLEVARGAGAVLFRGLDADPAKPSDIFSATLQIGWSTSGHYKCEFDMEISVEDTPAPAPLSGAKGDLSGRAWSAVKVNVPMSWKDNGYPKIDVTDLVRHVVSMPGWNKGNDILFRLRARHVSGSALGCYAGVVTNQHYSPRKPVLRVEFNGGLPEMSVRAREKQLVDLFSTYGGETPIVDLLDEGLRYFTGREVKFGWRRGGYYSWGNWMSNAGAVLDPESVWHQDPGSLLDYKDCAMLPYGCGGYYNYWRPGEARYKSPMTGDDGACQRNFMVLLTDGKATTNTAWRDIESNFVGKVCARDAYVMPDGSVSPVYLDRAGGPYNRFWGELCGREVVRWAHESDVMPAIPGKQTVETYTIGFNLCDAPNEQVLGGQCCAPGGAVDTDGDGVKDACSVPAPDTGARFIRDLARLGGGKFYEASSASELSDVFSTIAADIVSSSAAMAAPSLSVDSFNRVRHKGDVYLSLFRPSERRRWSGNVKRYVLCTKSMEVSGVCVAGDLIDSAGNVATDGSGAITGSAKSWWSPVPDGGDVERGGAGAMVPAWNRRRVYTYVGGYVSGVDLPADLSAPENRVGTDPGFLSFLSGFVAPGKEGQTALWLLGRDTGDYDNDGITDEQRWIFSDPLHASPVVVGYGGTPGDPVEKVFVAGNTEGLRMIDAKTGEEEWNFVPQELLSMAGVLSDGPLGRRAYGLDLTPSVEIVDRNNNGIIEKDGGDFVRLYLGMRRGGPVIYALDVTPPVPLTASANMHLVQPRLLWKIDAGTPGFRALGQTWSRPEPVIAMVQDQVTGEWSRRRVVVFGGGYSTDLDAVWAPVAAGGLSSGGGNAIYMVDADTGGLLWSVSTAGSGASLELPGMDWAIPAELTVVDRNGDHVADRLYAPDAGGRLWRVDLPAPSRPRGIGAMIADLSAPGVPGGARRFLEGVDLAYIRDQIYSGSGSYDALMLVSGNRAAPFDTSVSNRFYVIRDNRAGFVDADSDGVADGIHPVTEALLSDVTDNLVQDGDLAQQAAARLDLSSKRGWYLRLRGVGERGISIPVAVDGAVFFSTYTPPAGAGGKCNPDPGDTKVYGLDIRNGAALFAAWDSNPASLTGSDRVLRLKGAGMGSAVTPVVDGKGITLVLGTTRGIRKIEADVGTGGMTRSSWIEVR